MVRRSGVTKEAIHFYLREGLLPPPRKRGGVHRVEPTQFGELAAVQPACRREGGIACRSNAASLWPPYEWAA